jgi:hypothetical protein
MQAWWSQLTNIQQTLWVVALVATLFLAIQTVLSIVGIVDDGDDMSGGGVDIEVGVDTDLDTDLDGGEQAFDLAQWFSIRNVLAFLIGISWIGLGAISFGRSTLVALVLGALAGVAAVVLNVRILEALSKLRSTGNIRLENAVGKGARVSIAIPAALGGSGKVSISLQQRLIELEAVTVGKELIRGQLVTVVRVSEGRLVVAMDGKRGDPA